HFAEMGRDISREEFTVAGIGDMSGDVFGNGMLLSPHIRLVAAFDHRHVFLDPAPDAARSLEERRRLAALPGSSWADYDRSLLSPGGGVHERGARRIALTAEVKALLQAAELQDRSEATPDELVRAILRMPVDLLWNGGIGTYVKASTESHADAQDRGNDSVRVDGAALRARVVGEGGNLGFTQRGRIEYALAGGRINTDSIDNSAGVNTSDIEVNLKILLGTRRSRQRDALLRRITPDVVRQVLRTNRLQGAALSLAERDVAQRPATWQALIRHLVRNEGLDPRLERLPTEDELAERRRKGRALTRPELAVLMSWQKLALQRQLLASRLPEDPHFAVELERYFPAAAVRAAGRRLAGHRLRREIIATVTANTLVNHMGPTFPLLMAQATGADAADIARAYTLVREALQLRDLWDALESPAHALPMAARYEAAAEGIELTRHLCSSLLRLAPHSELADLSAALRRLRGPLAQLAAGAGQWCRGEELAQLRRREAHFAALGLPADLTARVAALEVLKPAPELLRLARGSRRTITEVAGLHAELGAQLGLDWLRHRTLQLDDSDPWQAAAVDALQDVQWHLQARATARALQRRDGWRPRTQDMDAWQQQREALQAMATPTLAALAVGTDSVRRLLSRPA
ncbi:MAG: NAD-glutamate dehydrogenase, partial [Pseudomonadota bacterium]